MARRVGSGLWIRGAVLGLSLLWSGALACAQAAPDMQQVQHEYEAGYAAASGGNLEQARQHFAAVVKLAPGLAEGHNALGSVLLEQGRARDAAAQFEAALKLKPLRSAEENLGLAYVSLGEREKAIAQLGKAAAEAPLSPAGALAYAPLLEAAYRRQDAIAMLRATIEQTPTEVAGATQAARAQLAALHDALGSLLAQEGDSANAQAQFQVAIQMDERTSAHFHLGVALLDAGQPAAALTELSAAVALAPDDANVLLYLGRAQVASGQDADGIATLRKAETATKAAHADARASTEIDYQLALALQNTRTPGDAIPYFQRVIAAEPKNAEALANYALALVQTGKAKDALAFYNRAIALQPDNVTTRMGLGAAYLQQNELVDAEEQFRKAVAIAPDNAELHYDLGLTLKLRDKLNDAEPELKRAADLDPSLVDPHVTLGTMYMQQGKFEVAADEMKLVLAVQPQNGDMWATYGSTLKQAGKLEQAEDALQKAIALLPEQPGPHTTLAGILQQDGKTEEAAAERKTAASLTRGAMNRQAAMFATNAGDLLLSKGQVAEAIAQYRTAIKDDAAYKPAHRQLAMALEQKGQKAEAEEERRLGEESAATVAR